MNGNFRQHLRPCDVPPFRQEPNITHTPHTKHTGDRGVQASKETAIS